MATSVNKTLFDVAESLQPGANLEDSTRKLEFRNAVQEGLNSLDRGERLPLDEVRKLLLR